MREFQTAVSAGLFISLLFLFPSTGHKNIFTEKNRFTLLNVFLLKQGNGKRKATEHLSQAPRNGSFRNTLRIDPVLQCVCSLS